MIEKKELVIKALKAEKERFVNLGHNVDDHDFAIEYLKTGEIKANLTKYELLESCVNSFDDVYAIYCL